ncbi:hypothetical protein MNBD_BACTEROID01-6 [hydrothermal vent metagenome]|uniref:Phophatidylinositol-4-phosphate 5-kinase n=1 Tax=hydrothermal vent metagenome TaxID=652676 RepID=A0A3B0T4J4_9ZZZZ
MKKTILLLLLFAISISYAQEIINQTDEAGLRQGLWKKYYPNGNLRYEGYFKDNQPTGEWERYYENAKPQAIIHYSATSDSATAKLFDPSGQKIAEGFFLDKKKAGLWEFYSKNRVTSQSNYTDGVKNGLSKNYYPSGELLEESEWKMGVQEGRYRAYYKNGSPYIEFHYIDNKRDGICKSYFPNGRVEMEAFYKKGQRHGDWAYFDQEGNLLYTLKYANGELLNPEVLDSLQSEKFNTMEHNKGSIPDPEKFLRNPTEYMIKDQMQK